MLFINWVTIGCSQTDLISIASSVDPARIGDKKYVAGSDGMFSPKMSSYSVNQSRSVAIVFL
jgi:hypothetical protein